MHAKTQQDACVAMDGQAQAKQARKPDVSKPFKSPESMCLHIMNWHHAVPQTSDVVEVGPTTHDGPKDDILFSVTVR